MCTSVYVSFNLHVFSVAVVKPSQVLHNQATTQQLRQNKNAVFFYSHNFIKCLRFFLALSRSLSLYILFLQTNKRRFKCMQNKINTQKNKNRKAYRTHTHTPTEGEQRDRDRE